MTLSITIRCIDPNTSKHALLFASDNQVFKGPLKAKCEKLYTYLGPEDGKDYGIVMAISGDQYLGEEIFFDLMELFDEKIELNTDTLALDVLNLKKEIGEIANKVYQKYCARSEKPPQFELIIGACDTFTIILHVTQEGKTHYTDDFAMIGHGQISGGLLLLNKFYEKELSVVDAVFLASMIIRSVSEVDPTVSNNVDFKLCMDGKALDFTPDFLEDVVSQNSTRWDLLRNVYHQLVRNPEFEKKLKQFLMY